MPSLRSVAALTAMAGISAATPIEKRGAFSLPQTHMGFIEKNPGREMAKTYKKFGGSMPADVWRAAQSNGTGQGSVTTNPTQYDEQYLTQVNVGGVNMMLDFDTGSSDLWVFSSELPTSEQSGHAIYKPSASKKKSGYSWSIKYGDGSGASGDVYTDTVTIGSLTVTGQAVEAATSISSQFVKNTNNDGLLGLGFSNINQVKPQTQTTWFDTAVAAGDLKTAVFAAELKHQAPGKYDFGFIDTSAYTGSIAYANVNSANGFWEFTIDGYAVGGQKGSLNTNVIADTGTTLIYLPTNVVSAYYAKVSGAKYDSSQGGYTVPCSATLPDFAVSVNGQLRTTSGSYINYAPVSGSTCFGGIQRNTGLQGLSILGDVFLKSQYVVFDKTGPKVGFAPQK